MLTSVLVHAGLHHGRTICNAVLGRKGEEDDIHQKLMEAYPEVPGWVYATLGVIAFSLSIIATQVWDTDTPFWVTMVAVMLPVIYILPTTFLYANTGIAVCCGSSRVAECPLTTNVASVELDFADYPRVTGPWGCHDKHGMSSLDQPSTPHELNPTQLFKVFAIQPMSTGIQFTQDLKLAHYMKIPPRTTFWGTPRSLTCTRMLVLI